MSVLTILFCDSPDIFPTY